MNKNKIIFRIILLFQMITLSVLVHSQTPNKQKQMNNLIKKPMNPYYSNTDTNKLVLSEAE